VTASDLLAVSLLDIAWRPEAVRQLLGTSAAMVSGCCPPSAAISTCGRHRILDVAIWIRHSHSRAASRIRRDSGIPEPGHSRP